MKQIRTTKSTCRRLTYALSVCALTPSLSALSSGVAADERSLRLRVVFRPRSAKCAWQKYKGRARRIWCRRFRRQAILHPKSAFIYATVLEGAIRTSVNDGPVVIYRAGQNFPEMPGDRHTLHQNASKTEPAKLLAVFVVNTDD